MGTYVTPETFDRLLTVPIALPQTELRRGRSMQLASVQLRAGETLELRSLCLHVLRLLTPGVAPQLNNSALGLASVGIYATQMTGSGIGLVHTMSPGATAWNPYVPVRIRTPGTYRVVVSNNAANVDLALIVTGCLKYFTR